MLVLIRIILILFITIFWGNVKADDENFLKDCLETVKDKEKCNDLLKKTKGREEGKDSKKADLTKEENSSLKLRQDIKNALQSKNRLYVIKYLGEPDERFKSGPDYEQFIYRRPVSRRSELDQPDEEIKVVFRREFVTEVIHIPPPNESKTQFNFHEATKQHK